MSLVYYYPETDEIFESWYLDGCFFGLVDWIKWDEVIILREL